MSSEEELVQGVIETVDTAKKYRIELAELLEGLEEAKTQIVTSANTSRNRLRSHFDRLKHCIEAALDARLHELESQVSKEEAAALSPLVECQTFIQNSVTAAQQVLEEGKQLLVTDHESSKLSMLDFKKKVDQLGLESLPEIPMLADVACISIELPRDEEHAETQLLEAIKDYGRVITRAPVQICEVQERPGAMLVKWIEIEDEHALDLSEFRLQYCYGSKKQASSSEDENTDSFQEAYQGPATSIVVRHLRPGSQYTFRVCGRGEGAHGWSPWSVPCVAMTTLPPYEWQWERPGYLVRSSDHTVAETTAVHQPNSPKILFSHEQCYTCGHSIVFRVLEGGQNRSSSDDGIALCQSNTVESLLGPGVLFVSAEGLVYLDGHEKTTKLPSLSQGSTLTFDTEVLQSDKVRVTVEVNDKIVTFDWAVEDATSSQNSSAVSFGLGMMNQTQTKDICLYFAMKFSSLDWRIGVE